MIDYFNDWAKKTGTFQETTITTNAAGQPVISWSAVTSGSNLDVQFWTDTSNETDVNDRFVDQKKGKMLLKHGIITPTTKMRFYDGTNYYYIIGVDNVADFDEFYVISWRLDHGA